MFFFLVYDFLLAVLDSRVSILPFRINYLFFYFSLCVNEKIYYTWIMKISH